MRVASFHRNLTHEIGLIAHSCGVRSPRELHRRHAREGRDTGRSVLLDELFPTPSVRAAPAPSSRSSSNTASPGRLAERNVHARGPFLYRPQAGVGNAKKPKRT